MTVRNAILAMALAFAPIAFATNQPAPMFHNAFVKMATKALVEARSSQPQAETTVEGLLCDPAGASCYAEDSWTCCSKICIAALCN
jgi:hypothetical protein